MSHLDPHAEVPVVSIPVVLMADHAECMRAGAAIGSVARALGRRAIFVASTALSHALVRGRHHVPAPERAQADAEFIAQLERGAIDELASGFADYCRLTVAEMGGRALATLLGALQSMREGLPLAGLQFGAYAQSSGSGNANVVVAHAGTLAKLG
jgi:3,4-dihydroxyphenylacetate 2,3-dioxygenase